MEMFRDYEEEIRKRWGTDEQYYKELETFNNQHRNASNITYSQLTNTPMYAIYWFRPYQCWEEEKALRERIRREMEKDDATFEAGMMGETDLPTDKDLPRQKPRKDEPEEV